VFKTAGGFLFSLFWGKNRGTPWWAKTFFGAPTRSTCRPNLTINWDQPKKASFLGTTPKGGWRGGRAAPPGKTKKGPMDAPNMFFYVEKTSTRGNPRLFFSDKGTSGFSHRRKKRFLWEKKKPPRWVSRNPTPAWAFIKGEGLPRPGILVIAKCGGRNGFRLARPGVFQVFDLPGQPNQTPPPARAFTPFFFNYGFEINRPRGGTVWWDKPIVAGQRVQTVYKVDRGYPPPPKDGPTAGDGWAWGWLGRLIGLGAGGRGGKFGTRARF